MDSLPIEGHCPMGCGQTLAVQGGTISCQAPECPSPGLLHEMLADHRIDTHEVAIDYGDWTMQHPLHERITIEGGLRHCPLIAYLFEMAHTLDDGQYIVYQGNDGWEFHHQD